jgi:hypothetical protein
LSSGRGCQLDLAVSRSDTYSLLICLQCSAIGHLDHLHMVLVRAVAVGRHERTRWAQNVSSRANRAESVITVAIAIILGRAIIAITRRQAE